MLLGFGIATYALLSLLLAWVALKLRASGTDGPVPDSVGTITLLRDPSRLSAAGRRYRVLLVIVFLTLALWFKVLSFLNQFGMLD